MTSLFITLEGGEGAGKSTLLKGLRAHLQTRGIEPVLTREPGGTPFGEAARKLFLAHDYGALCAEAELLLVFAARAQHVHEVIAPALAEGRCVIADRFTDASYAYQGGGRGQPVERIQALETWTTGNLAPDLTLLLDIPTTLGRERIDGRAPRDRIEREADAFFHRVREAYRARAAAEPERFCLIDASQGPDEVLARAVAAINRLIEARST